MRRTKMIITAILLLVASLSMAQGIRFEDNLSWKQVLAKAKKDNKFIFVDAMATWCIPCKEMESKVYPDTALGSFANERFVSVKVQMDRTPKDSKTVRAWYTDAKNMMEKYEISAFPTYLFFSPDGKVVHQRVGLMEAASFLLMMRDSMDPTKQTYGRYYALLVDYNRGRKDYSELPFMVEMSKKFKKRELEQKLAMDYIHNYLLKLEEKRLYTEKNLDFIKSYASSDDKPVFKIFYPNGSRADSVINGISNSVLSEVILREEIKTKIVYNDDYKQPKVKRPDWHGLANDIKRKYGIDGNREINEAKLDWYRISMPDNNKLAEATIEYYTILKPIEKIVGYLKLLIANNVIYEDIAINVTDVGILKRSVDLQAKVIEKYKEERLKQYPNRAVRVANLIDTYACLLYKSGEVKKAIEVMEVALVEEPDSKILKHNLEVMKNGKPLKLRL